MDASASSGSIDAPAVRDAPPVRERWRLALCAALVLLGGVVLAGWFGEIEPLKSIVPGLPTMKVNTAISFVLTGCGIALAGYRGLTARLLAGVVALALALIGAATLAEYAWHLDLGIDQSFIADTGTLRGSGYPGRMSVLTATAWLALGASILLLGTASMRRQIVVGHAVGSYAAIVSVFSAAGYTFGPDAFAGLGFYTNIAVHTAVGLMIAAAAILLTKAQEGWLQRFAGSPAARDLLIRLLPLSIGAPLLLGLVLLLGAGLGAYNSAYAFALFIPATSLAMVLVALWVAGRHRQDELVQLRYERHLRLIAAELNHRVKNTLSIVQSLAHQSWKAPQSAEDAKSAFEGRLLALASAHDMLTRQNWEEVSVAEVAAAALSPHALCGTRITIDGPTVMLPPKACVTLAMTLHELATNAIKYGALSTPGARLDVAWSIDQGRFRLTWLEREGPRCSPPEREGFGTRMLRRALAADLGGTATLAFDPAGFRFELHAPAPPYQ